MSDEIERKTTQLFPQKYLLKFRKGQPLIFGSAYLTSTQNILWERNAQKRSKWRFFVPLQLFRFSVWKINSRCARIRFFERNILAITHWLSLYNLWILPFFVIELMIPKLFDMFIFRVSRVVFFLILAICITSRINLFCRVLIIYNMWGTTFYKYYCNMRKIKIMFL